jgi:site-specific DNA-methyltransferase (adenine-specific)
MLDAGFYLMDCMIGMKQFPDKFWDLAIVDPPYGIGMDNQKVRVKPSRPNSYERAGECNYKISEWDYAAPDKSYFDELFRVSKNQIIWGANYFSNMMPAGKGWIYWDKQIGDNNFSSGEFAYQSVQIKSSCFSNPTMTVQGTRIHPTQKPLALYEWLLTRYAHKGDKILDTHVGSASSLIACHQLGFQYWGFELDADYYKAANERLERAKAQVSLLDIAPETVEQISL